MQCPDDAVLQDFVDERSKEHVNVLLRMHLRQCAPCRELVSMLSPAVDSPRPFEGTSRHWGHPGDVLGGRYRLQRRIGEGAMGVVWAAVDERSGAPGAAGAEAVALKLLRLPDSVSLRRFARECRILTALEHPNIVRVYDVAEPAEGGYAYVVMELLDGETLEELLVRRGTLSLAEALELGRAVLAALGYAHRAGVIHRDLKPHNVFVHRDAAGVAVHKVIGFGLAKPTADWNARASTLTRTGTVVGTPRYMAPEQLFDDPAADHRVDLWALGIVLYRALSGGFPHEGRTLGEIVRAFAERRSVPLSTRAPELPSDVTAFVASLLGREPDERPRTAALALADLEAVLARHGASFAARAVGS